MCECPEPVPCDFCNSMVEVCEYQGVHLCTECLTWRCDREKASSFRW